MAIKILGLKKDHPAKKEPLITMTVNFGPAFTNGKLTRKQFVEKLRETANRRKNSFLGEMFNHYADHLEAAAAHLGGNYALDKTANLHIENAYYGEGSCSGCSLSQPGGSCCRCDHDDVSSCEPCG